MFFLENEVQIDKNNNGVMLFLLKQVSLPVCQSPSYKNWKSAQKVIYMYMYTLFARKSQDDSLQLDEFNLHFYLWQVTRAATLSTIMQ